jgi:outer membrane protein
MPSLRGLAVRTAEAAIVATAPLLASWLPAAGDTLPWAIVQAYQNNPSLNAQRASLRATDEVVPQALSGYRPRITATGTFTEAHIDTLTKAQDRGGPVYTRTIGQNFVQSYGLTATQTILNGFQTGNRTRQGEAQVFAARETLRLTEQAVLGDAVTAYMNLLRDTAILELQRSNVLVLEEQLKQTRDRFSVGEVTRTDVAQAESRLAAGRSQLLQAESNYTASRAIYRQVIGVDPGRLAPGHPVDRLSPRTLAAAIALGRVRHPSVTTLMYNVDVALMQVKIAEGALYPNFSIQGNAQKTYGSTTSLNVLENFSATLSGQLSIPIYQGGGEYSLIRQAKEVLGQRRFELDVNRDQVQSLVTQAWGALEAAKAQIQSTTAQVAASEIALTGVREEARVGQRTTLDVLNAQQELVNARVALVTAQRDRVVASFGLLAAVGRLSVTVLGAKVEVYEPMTHYQQIRDAWIGVRNPDGR